jgi:hypothetical protein
MLSGDSTTRTQAVHLKPQPWRWSHPRVLVEHPDDATGLAIASGLRFAGYAVGVCPGPQGHGKCPLTGPAGRAPAHDADIVVCSLGYESETARKILRELRTRYPDTTLLVEVPPDIDTDLQELLEGCQRLPAPASPDQVVAAVQSLSGHAGEEDPAGA